MRDQARQDVDRLAGGKADDEADGLGRIGLRRGEARQGRQGQNAGGEALEFSARYFHRILPIAVLYPMERDAERTTKGRA